jgi:hypothetical protein
MWRGNEWMRRWEDKEMGGHGDERIRRWVDEETG